MSSVRAENIDVKLRYTDAHIPTTEEHQDNEQVDQALKTDVSLVELDWEHKSELSVA